MALAAALAAIALPGAGCRKAAVATHGAPAVVSQSPAAPSASAPSVQAAIDRTVIPAPAEPRPAPEPPAQAGETSAAELARAAGELPAVPKVVPAAAPAAARVAAVRRSREHHRPVVAPTAVATPAAQQPAPAAPTPSAPVSGESSRQIDDMVRGALDGTESRGTEPHHEIEALPALSREEILTAMKGIRPRIKDCYRQYGQRGMAWVRVEVGGGGSVSSATVTGTFADSPTGACVEAAVKTAHFPASEGLAFRYPFPVR